LRYAIGECTTVTGYFFNEVAVLLFGCKHTNIVFTNVENTTKASQGSAKDWIVQFPIDIAEQFFI